MKPLSQCDRVLQVLQDGDPHDIVEIHRRAGTMRLNSRVAELRKRGFAIACWRADGTYVYQALPPFPTAPGSAGSAGSAALPGASGSGQGPVGSLGRGEHRPQSPLSRPARSDEQLVIGAA